MILQLVAIGIPGEVQIKALKTGVLILNKHEHGNLIAQKRIHNFLTTGESGPFFAAVSFLLHNRCRGGGGDAWLCCAVLCVRVCVCVRVRTWGTCV